MPMATDLCKRLPPTGLRRIARMLRAPMLFCAILATGICGMLMNGGGAAFAGQPVNVTIDKNYVLRTDRPVHTVVVGNPYIADVSAQNSRLLFVLGKAMGETNVLGFDADGNVIFDKDVSVVPHMTRTVTVHRGGLSKLAGMETFACAPRCENTVRPGDNLDLFDKLDAQANAYSNLSKNAVGIVTGSAAGRGG